MKKILFILSMTLLMSCGIKEFFEYNELIKFEKTEKNYSLILDKSNEFLKKYPKSNKVEEVENIKKDILLLMKKEEIYNELKKEFDSQMDKIKLTEDIKKLEGLKETRDIIIKKIKNENLESKFEIEELNIEKKILKIKTEIEIKRKKELEKKEIIKKIYSNYDDFDQRKWFYGKDDNGNKTIKSSPMYLYGGGDKGDLKQELPSYLVIRLNYNGDSWVFFNEVKISFDGNVETFYPDYSDIRHEAYRGGVNESYDIVIGSNNEYYIDIFERIASAKKVKIRFSGDDYYDIKNINNKSKQQIKNIISAYKFNKIK